jgi:hypothetical protein
VVATALVRWAGHAQRVSGAGRVGDEVGVATDLPLVVGGEPSAPGVGREVGMRTRLVGGAADAGGVPGAAGIEVDEVEAREDLLGHRARPVRHPVQPRPALPADAHHDRADLVVLLGRSHAYDADVDLLAGRGG